jgi:pyruvate ferredoxin oxidoreductase alpha subunit
MTRTLLTGNGAAAWAARLADVDYVPAFPITPQTEIIETIAHWIDTGEMASRMVTLESEHSMITAAGAAAATGARVFTATSSQGLMYGMEMIFTVAGWRAPFVLVNVSRGLSAPLTLEPDHNDVMAARDSGLLQIHCSTGQEVLDSVLLAYRIAEDRRVRMPVIVNMDGFYLSFTREPIELPDPALVAKFLPAYDAAPIGFRASKPISEAVAVLGGTPYSYFRYEVHLAAMKGLEVFEEAARDFAKHFGRSHGPIDAYRTEDAEVVLVMMGSFATKARDAVDRLRETGMRVGLVRPRLFRPFPVEAFRRALAGKSAVAVIDQNLSMGKGGILHTELASALYGVPRAPKVLASFVGGLGGRDISPEEFYEIAAVAKRAGETGETPPPRLLYTGMELRHMRKLQAIAEVERAEVERVDAERRTVEAPK